MCGIGLWFSHKKKLAPKEMHDFMHSILHRGPDYQEIKLISEHVLLANNRLALIDHHPRSNQPLTYKKLHISFNGAIYNFKELKKELIAKGHEFETEGDTEVILHLYEEYGEACFNKMDGMWALILFDEDKKKLILSRDRFGIKPIYYLKGDQSIFVGSELKQFRHIPGFKMRHHAESVTKFIGTGGFKNHGSSTLFSNIRQVEPGTFLTYSLLDFNLERERYYDLSEQVFNKKPSEAELVALIKKAISIRTIGDYAPSVMLSGGLDSSIIAEELWQKDNGIRSYSYVDPWQPMLNEEPYVEAFVQQFPHENHRIAMKEWDKKLLEECNKAQDEPLASVSGAAQFLLYKMAKQNKEKLMLSGQGADENFGGYPNFVRFINPLDYLANPKAFMEGFRMWNNKKTIPALLKGKEIDRPPLKSMKEYSIYLIQERGLRDLLQYEDRNSMYHSIETRLPFIDHRLVESALNLSAYHKLKNAELKGLLKTLYADKLPKKIIQRKNKLAFDTPEKQLIKKGFINTKEEWNKAADYFKELDWNKNNNLNSLHELQVFQLYFLNHWYEMYCNG